MVSSRIGFRFSPGELAAAAAFAGLLFVGLSINLSRIIAVEGLASAPA